MILIDFPRGAEQLRLDLVEEQSPRRVLPSKDVNRPWITELIECVLGEGEPTMGRQGSADLVMKRGVPGVEQRSQLGPTPFRVEIDLGTELFDDPKVRLDAQPAEFPALDPRDGLLRHSGGPGKVLLPKPLVSAKRPNDQTRPH